MANNQENSVDVIQYGLDLFGTSASNCLNLIIKMNIDYAISTT